MNDCCLQSLLKSFRGFFGIDLQNNLAFLRLLLTLSKQLSPDFGFCLPILVLNRTYLLVVQLNGFSKSYLSFSVRPCRNSLLQSFVCFKSANSSKEFTTNFSHRVCNNPPVESRSNIRMGHYAF